MKKTTRRIAYWLVGIALALVLLYANGRLVERVSAQTDEAEPQEVVVMWKHTEVITYEPVKKDYEIILPENVVSMDDFDRNVCLLAQTLWGESRGMSDYENSLVAWCICNRVDSSAFPDSIEAVIKQVGQFHGYNAKHPIDQRLYDIAKDVLIRWQMEKQCIGSVGRTLPENMLFFYGLNGHNKYRKTNSGAGRYDFTDELPSPYSE